ncbi:DMT family transporter [Pyrococcus horikoshii]|nr:DMT family transporter [Pyrococcus horikoshii]HII60691.1 DMT family transporter [Pyrococcus horikoshii]
MNFALGVILAFSAAFTWALTSVLSKVSMRRVSPLTLNFLRLVIASGFYLPLIIYLNLIPSKGIMWWVIVVFSGIIGFMIGDWLFLEGMKLLGVSRANMLTTLHPIITMVLAHYLLGRPLNAYLFLGAGLIILAVLLLLSEKSESGGINARGVLLVVVAELLWTIAILITDWLVSNEPPVLIAALRISSGILGGLPFLPKMWREIRKLRLGDMGLVFVISLLGTIVGQYLFIKSISLVSSTVATPVTESTPIMASLLAVVFLREKITSKLVASMMLSFIGILIIGVLG